MISSARLRMEFMDCTHSIWSDAFRVSSTPSASAICSMMRLHLSVACSFRSARYRRNGFAKADGVYEETFSDGFALHEYGYEIKVESSKMK